MHVKSATYSGYVRQSMKYCNTGELPNFFLAKIARRSLLLVTERDRYSIIKLEWRNDKHAVDIINLYLILRSKAF